MKTSDNETVAEVCAELKEAASGENVSCDGLVVEISRDEIWDACDRIEAAHGREVAELRECLKEACSLQLRCNSCKIRKCDSICAMKLKWRTALDGESGS